MANWTVQNGEIASKEEEERVVCTARQEVESEMRGEVERFVMVRVEGAGGKIVR